MGKHILKRAISMVIALLMLINISPILNVQAETKELNSMSKFIVVDNKEMHVILYGGIDKTGTFANQSKETLVMLPALGVPSPNIYYKPLAEALTSEYNIIVIEPFGYGLSDTTETARTVENINRELYDALDVLSIDICTLLVHSISGIYGLNFVYAYPEKVDAFIAIDNTVYDETLEEALAMEQDYMQQAAEEFDSLRNTFDSIEEFETAIAENPGKYGAELPEINGYTYTNADREEYYTAYARSSNRTIQNEIQNMGNALDSIKEKKFPSTLPVLMMIASENVENMPAWETAHREQLDLASERHKLYIVKGGHYIWYTNLSSVVDLIKKCKES